MQNLTIKTISYKSPEYYEMAALRNTILRIPIGMRLSEKDIENESMDIFIAGFDNEKLIACCILTKQNNTTTKLRQMAVAEELQNTGIGSQLLKYAEEEARKNRFETIVLHARKEAVAFYERNGYTILGSEFFEVGIPHFEMSKTAL